MKTRGAAVACVLLCTSLTASAAPARRKAPAAAPVPVAPAPNVKLVIDAPTTRGPWTMRVTNDGQVPVRLVGDARLLVLDVTPRGARKAVRCELPADMRPGDDMNRALVLPPGRSYAESFEPRLYCFGARELDALAPGATVAAHLGWMGRFQTRPPFAVAPLDGVEPVVAALKAVDAPPIALPDEPTAVLAATAPVSADDPDPVNLTLTGQRAIDAESPGDITITVTLHNAGKRPVTVRFRPETLAFDVVGSVGVEHCGWPTFPGAPLRETFSTLPAHGSESQTVLLKDYCGGHSFDAPGLVVVRPALDTRKASGAPIGLRTFDGQVIATTPTVLRLHQGTARQPLGRPRLEPAP